MKNRKIKVWFIFLLTIISYHTKSQNLVPNGQFESFISTPNISGQVNLAQPWQGLNATPDLYSGQATAPATPCDYVDVPYNVGGYTPSYSSGDAYAGIQIDINNNYREYISVPLSFQLLKDTLYRIEFRVIRADSCRYAINRIGALLSSNIPIQSGTGVINFTPQIEYNTIISDTLNWTLITSIYQATGTETYLTLGCFRDDTSPLLQNTDFGAKNTGCSSFDNSAYYFIDEVMVRPANESVEILGDSVICPGESTTLYASTNVPFWWSTLTQPNDTASLDASITLQPTSNVTYLLHGVTKTDTVRVRIVPAPVLDLGGDTLICENDSIELNAYGSDIISYNWSTGEIDSIIYIHSVGTYTVEVYNDGCNAIDTIEITGQLSNEQLDLGNDSAYCFFIADTLRLDAGLADEYLWLPFGDTTRRITVLSPNTYTCTITRANGCQSTASINASEICEPTLFAPNSFTPDGDGINDIFQVFCNNYLSFSLRIQNRRGQTVFYTENPFEGWDGKYDNEEAPIGVYVWRVNYRGLDFEGIKVKKKSFGTITLIR